MGKPYGMTADFRIVCPTRIEDDIWDAVEAAVLENWTPEQMIQEVRECWAQALRDKLKDAEVVFKRAAEGRN